MSFRQIAFSYMSDEERSVIFTQC